MVFNQAGRHRNIWQRLLFGWISRPCCHRHRLGGVGHMPYIEAAPLVAELIMQNVRSAEAS